jgi:phytoene desaturase
MNAIVVGAGLGGLGAAITMAAAGAQVLVVEAAPGPGGKAGTLRIGDGAVAGGDQPGRVEAGDGVEVDTGPSVLTLPDAFDAVLGPAGVRLDDLVRLRRPDPAFRYIYDDGLVLDLRPELDDSLAAVEGALGSTAAAELRAYLDHTRRIWEVSAPSFVYGPPPSFAGMMALGPMALGMVRQIDPLRSMWRSICALVREPHLRLLLARFATYNGSDPRRAPATLGCIAHVELGLGGFGVEGGIGALITALVALAQSMGVTFAYSEPIDGLVIAEDGAVRGVRRPGAAPLTADVVVCNNDAAQVAAWLPAGRTPRTLANRSTPSTSGWTGILRARRTATPRVAHQVLFPPNYLDEFADLFDRRLPPAVPSVYVCAQEACHGRTGWPSAEPLFVMTNAPATSRTAPAADPVALGERALARLATAGLIGSDDTLVWSRSPQDLANQFPGSDGGLYGAASNDRAAAFQRPPNRLPSLPGLYLASGSAHPGGGMPLCFLSGRSAGQAALRDQGREAR